MPHQSVIIFCSSGYLIGGRDRQFSQAVASRAFPATQSTGRRSGIIYLVPVPAPCSRPCCWTRWSWSRCGWSGRAALRARDFTRLEAFAGNLASRRTSSRRPVRTRRVDARSRNSGPSIVAGFSARVPQMVASDVVQVRNDICIWLCCLADSFAAEPYFLFGAIWQWRFVPICACTCSTHPAG